MLRVLLLPDESTYTIFELDGLSNLLISAHPHLRPPLKCITAYIRIARISIDLFWMFRNTLRNVGSSIVITTCALDNEQRRALSMKIT